MTSDWLTSGRWNRYLDKEHTDNHPRLAVQRGTHACGRYAPQL